MAILPIYNCFHPVLKKKTNPVAEMDGSLKKLVDDMFETMYKADGIGLAANQVGIELSVIVIDTAASKDDEGSPPLTLINPVIEAFSDEDVSYTEGCLSVPTFYEDIQRPEGIQLKYYDIDGTERRLSADKLLSRVIQHEVDHLDGILFFEKLSPLKRALSKSKLKKIQRGDITGDYPMILPDGTQIHMDLE